MLAWGIASGIRFGEANAESASQFS